MGEGKHGRSEKSRPHTLPSLRLSVSPSLRLSDLRPPTFRLSEFQTFRLHRPRRSSTDCADFHRLRRRLSFFWKSPSSYRNTGIRSTFFHPKSKIQNPKLPPPEGL